MNTIIALALLLFSQNAWAAGGVTDGQRVNAAITNAAFLFKNADDTMPWNLGLSSSVGSDGSSIARLQRYLNAISSYTGVSTSDVYNVNPSWTSNVVGSSTNSLFTRANLLTALFNGTTGHVHSGSDGDAPQIPLTTGITGTLAVTHGGTGITSGTSGGIPYFSSSSTIASSGLLTASQVLIGGGAATTPSALAAGSQYQVLTMGAANPAYGAVNLAQAAAVTGVLPNANTTATNANTASTIVARDGSGNFTAGTITAALTGNATTATDATTATNATNTAITDDTTTNATMYPTWVTTASSNQAQKVSSTKLTFNPSTGTLTTTTVAAAVTGTASGNTTYSANQYGVVLSGSGNAMSVLAPDADTTKVLTSGGSSANPSWQAVASAPTMTLDLVNVGFSATISTNTLIIALKQSDGSTNCGAGSAACKIGFRSATAGNGDYQTISFTAAASVTLPATASLGNPASGANTSVFVYAIQDTTSEICVSSSELDEGALTSATATPATTAGTLYCTNTHTSRPIRKIARVTATWSNPNWSAVANVAQIPFGDRCATTNASFSWDGTGGASSTGTLAIVTCRRGDWVQMFVPTCQATSRTTSTNLTASAAIPIWAWPLTGITTLPVNTMRNSGGDTHAGIMQLSTAGIIQFYRDNASTAFSSGVNAGVSSATSYVYYVGNGS